MEDNQLDLETVAYINQLTEDLVSFLTEEGQVTVIERSIVKEIRRRKKHYEDYSDIEKLTHMVLFVVTDQGAEIKFKGYGMSLEEAAKNAKNATLKFLGDMSNEAMSNADRNNEINAILTKSNTIH